MKVTDKAVFETTKGKITIGLYGEDMPVTVKNFIKHVEAKYYNKLIFHRVIPGFVIQGGGMLKGMFEKTALGEPIKLERNPKILHKQYTLSMARTSEPNSATSQFFICTDDCPSLDNQYAAFGTVLEGMEVVDAIAAVKTTSVRHYDDVPVEPIVIENAVMVKE
ncbi:MAG TPA: peptidylprolyl isomerase [bacterium]|nr:peptidylprolyl isomerase [bacterium]